MAAVAAAVLTAGGLAVPAAFAGAGDLAFVNCNGLLPDCTSTAPWNAVSGADAVAVTPDGTNLYVAALTGGYNADISHFTIDRAGNLTYRDCIGDTPGCTPTSPAHVLDLTVSLAVSPDGRNLYAAGGGLYYGSVSHLSIGDRGSLTYDGCYGYFTGCTQTNPEEALSGAAAVTVTPDGKHLYVASESKGAVSHLTIDAAGNLTFDGCVSNFLAGCTPFGASSSAVFEALAVTPDGKYLYALSGFTAPGAVYQFVIDPAGILLFTGCIGNEPTCVPVSPPNMLYGGTGLLVNPAGGNLYVSARHAVSYFRIGASGTLIYTGCIGNVTGCRVPSPAGALEGADGLAATSDGAHVYVPSESGSEVSRFGVDASGNLVFAGCTGELAGCAGTSLIHALDGAFAVAVSPNNTHLYVAGFEGDDVSHFTIAGF